MKGFGDDQPGQTAPPKLAVDDDGVEFDAAGASIRRLRVKGRRDGAQAAAPEKAERMDIGAVAQVPRPVEDRRDGTDFLGSAMPPGEISKSVSVNLADLETVIIPLGSSRHRDTAFVLYVAPGPFWGMSRSMLKS